MSSLRSRLDYEPVPLQFGTSGRRGEVVHLSQLEIYISAAAEIDYLKTLTPENGGVTAGDEFFIAYDLRPSSTSFVPSAWGRGEIAQAVVQAIAGCGLRPVNLGCIPTPALTFYALSRQRGSIMITGSHIPFNRNGYKLNTSRGELLKHHEAPINRTVETVRERVYGQPFDQSPFNPHGMLKAGHQDLPAEDASARKAYQQRYLDFFAGRSLAGKRILVYQHSAVGRDLLVQVLEHFGAAVVPAGRSDTFVPIDTENIDDAQLAVIQSLVDQAGSPLDAVVSIDGDSDRPLVLGLDPGGNRARFFSGDLLGMVAAQFLGADAAVVPISCNDAIDRSAIAPVLEPKTRIGSPYVIAGMQEAIAKGRKIVCGWEANGGFLLGSDINRNGRSLRALATRDAFLPILCVLFAAQDRNQPLTAVFDELPRRFSRSVLLKDFPRPISLRILQRFGRESNPQQVRKELGQVFTAVAGFSELRCIDYTDGLRITFLNGDVAHVRPSGNADELRMYAVADSIDRANTMAQAAVAEPDGLLRKLESFVA